MNTRRYTEYLETELTKLFMNHVIQVLKFLFFKIEYELCAYRSFAVIIAVCQLQLIAKHFRLQLLSVSHAIYTADS